MNAKQTQYLCTACWHVFEEDTSTCPHFDKSQNRYICGAARPTSGWPTLPYAIRNHLLLHQKLSAGGMGAVFLAYQTAHRRNSVVKVVQQIGDANHKKALLDLFNNEVDMTVAMSALSPKDRTQSPPSKKHYIEHYHSDRSGTNPGILPFLELEYVEMPTLHTWFTRTKKGEISNLEVVRIGIAMAESLIVMHKHNYVHRDLKLSNLFFDGRFPDPSVKVFDFGLAIQGGADPEKTSFRELYPSGVHVPGSEEYMSPEQMALQPLWPVSDIHSVGSILWKLVCKGVPFPIDSGSSQKERLKARRIAVRKVPPRPEVMDRKLYAVLAQALAFDPEKRFPKRKSDPTDYTAAMGLVRELRRVERKMLVEQKLTQEANLKTLAKLKPRVERIVEKVASTIELAPTVDQAQDQLAGLCKSPDSPELGDPAVAQQVKTLVQEVKTLEAKVFSTPTSWALKTLPPWLLAGFTTACSIYLYIHPPNPPLGSTQVHTNPPPQNPKDLPTQAEVSVNVPVPGSRETGPAQLPLINSADGSTQVQAIRSQKGETGTPTESGVSVNASIAGSREINPVAPPPCSPLSVTLDFDMPVNVKIDGVPVAARTKTTTVELPPDRKSFKVEFDDGIGLCHSSKPLEYHYDNLVVRNADGTCRVKPPALLKVSETCL